MGILCSLDAVKKVNNKLELVEGKETSSESRKDKVFCELFQKNWEGGFRKKLKN